MHFQPGCVFVALLWQNRWKEQIIVSLKRSVLHFKLRKNSNWSFFGLFSVKAQIFYNIFGIHRDPHYWKQPDLFVPELHFNTEEGQRQHQYAFLPWSVGERKCIGMNLAYFHTKLTLLMIYKLFVLRVNLSSRNTMRTGPIFFEIPLGFLRVPCQFHL